MADLGGARARGRSRRPPGGLLGGEIGEVHAGPSGSSTPTRSPGLSPARTSRSATRSAPSAYCAQSRRACSQTNAVRSGVQRAWRMMSARDSIGSRMIADHMTSVETTRGGLRGAHEDGIAVFRGIPYAQPPVGALRLRAPQPVERWREPRDATRFGPAQPQRSDALPARLGLVPERTDEDCLTLNVFTPRPDAAARPVLVWLHGGAFIGGSACAPLYDGKRLTKRGDLVVVTLNYRVGTLGFSFGPDSVANLGLFDQIAALRWVREEIAAFGGDPRRVTVFGESAGAGSLLALAGMPAAEGLFQRAIVQSAAPAGVLQPAEAAERTEPCGQARRAGGLDARARRARGGARRPYACAAAVPTHRHVLRAGRGRPHARARADRRLRVGMGGAAAAADRQHARREHRSIRCCRFGGRRAHGGSRRSSTASERGPRRSRSRVLALHRELRSAHGAACARTTCSSRSRRSSRCATTPRASRKRAPRAVTPGCTSSPGSRRRAAARTALVTRSICRSPSATWTRRACASSPATAPPPRRWPRA